MRLADTDRVPFGHLSDDLHVGIFVVQFRDMIEPAAVDILIGIYMQHIERGVHLELFTKNVGTFGTDILAISYISVGKLHDY